MSLPFAVEADDEAGAPSGQGPAQPAIEQRAAVGAQLPDQRAAESLVNLPSLIAPAPVVDAP
jgi:hypothetical protein